MPLHDWSKVPAGLFHHFHQTWTIDIKTALNSIPLPRDYCALVERKSEGAKRSPREIYSGRANRIVIKHHLGRTIAVIEILSPGNKDSRAAIQDFINKTLDYLRAGIHVLLLDLFPPSPRDPLGIHKLLWDEIDEEPFAFPDGKNRILASYEAGVAKAAYVEPIGVGDVLPDMPLFLAQGMHVKVPLEPTYLSAWEACPEALREAVVTGVLPNPDAEE